MLLLLSLKGDSKGAFHSTQNSGNFGWLIKWKGPFRFGPTGIFGTSFEGCPQWPVWTFRSVGPKCAFPFAKIVVPSTALLYPAYKNKYSRLPITRTFKGNRKRFELSGVRVIGGSKKIAESKVKNSFYCTVNILITFNCRNVKWKLKDTSRL